MDKNSDQIECFLSGNGKIHVPFDLHVEDQIYICTEVLRRLPQKRLVVKAHCGDKQLVIKLFAKKKNGERELLREKDGYQSAKQAGIRVPELMFSTDNADDYCAIAYEYLENAKSFANKERTFSKYINELLDLVGGLHNSGIYQSDFHLDNVLISANHLYLIDLASIKGVQQTRGLGKQTSLENLAMLVAQFKPKQQQILIDHLHQYYGDRGWEFDVTEKNKFNSYVGNAWQKRKTNYLSKRFRNCTMTEYKKTFSEEYGFRRTFFDEVGMEFINDIDDIVSSGRILKAGNSATVVKVTYAGKELVIKRYNIKNFWHFIKHCCRPSRAAISWRQGNLLQLLGIPTPKPLGFIEQRCGWFRKTAYLICEYSNGQALSAVFEHRSPTEDEFVQVKNIFDLFKKYQISHGDLKATNLLLENKDKIQLIDLDAMQEHRNAHVFHLAFNKDRQRFMRNWQDEKMNEKFKSLL